MRAPDPAVDSRIGRTWARGGAFARLLEGLGEQDLLHEDEARRERRQVLHVHEVGVEVPRTRRRVVDVTPTGRAAAGPAPDAVGVLRGAETHERSAVGERV